MEEEKGMVELRKIAGAYYNTSTDELKNLAKNFFKSLDQDGNDQVTLPEFLAYIREEGHPDMRNKEFFNKLDKDKNRTLDFNEVMTLFYIIKSGRPFCGACGEFIPGMFFTCLTCFDSTTGQFSVCLACYCEENYIHKHKQFIDNYALLEVKRTSAVKEAIEKAKNKAKADLNINIQKNCASPSAPTSHAIVPYQYQRNKRSWQTKLGEFAGGVASAFCSIM